jgi:putative transposase
VQRVPRPAEHQLRGPHEADFVVCDQTIEEENRKLKQLVADLSLDKHMLQEALRKNW